MKIMGLGTRLSIGACTHVIRRVIVGGRGLVVREGGAGSSGGRGWS